MNKKEKKLFDLYAVHYTGESLYKLKEWCEEQLKEGYTTFDYNLSWGYYNDIDGIDLEASK